MNYLHEYHIICEVPKHMLQALIISTPHLSQIFPLLSYLWHILLSSILYSYNIKFSWCYALWLGPTELIVQLLSGGIMNLKLNSIYSGQCSRPPKLAYKRQKMPVQRPALSITKIEITPVHYPALHITELIFVRVQ